MIQLKPAQASDSNKLLALLESTPQQGIVTLNFERQPNFFHGAEIASQQPFITLAEDESTGNAVAVYSNGKRDVFVNGKRRAIRYAHDLRIAKNHRGKHLIQDVIEESQKVMEPDEYSQIVILEENAASLTAVASGRSGLATFHPYGKLVTYIMSTTYDFAPKSSLTIRRADNADIPAIQTLFNREAANKQFYPVYDFQRIGKDSYYRGLSISDYFLAFENNMLVGFIGTWRQKDFKQTRVVEYPPWMIFLRPFYNIWCTFFGGFPLPLKKSVADYVSLHSIITQDNRPDILSGLLSYVRRSLSSSGDKTMILGIADNDPIKAATKGFIYRTMKSNHYLAGFGEDARKSLDHTRPLYIEVSRL
ncbi:hypothetical protein A9Q99_10320 [Gammaproteobacteria bacterium 45_16_T64]|nr:hypothetical protein A9Q99_10320 [Gammaproteobacteria bacterium 45_16_T64]